MTNFATKLIEFSTWLEDFTPDVLNDLGESASAEVLAKLSDSYAGRVPDDVLTVYAWHDGGQIPDPWWELSEIVEVLRVKNPHESVPDPRALENWWRDAWIPVGADGDGIHKRRHTHLGYLSPVKYENRTMRT
ncbi:MAG: SMI1/KNR4 family protein [Gammaproteobacteria bacterium]|nr:SMI1/KNR4 family protein [Gammaproteobacteria bacterium]